jgi:hypothetical protein
MKLLTRIITLLGITILPLFITRPVLAFPHMPSSFYGTVKVNDANVLDGTIVKALIKGKVIAQVKTQTYQGSSVYALDVPGDDPDTAAIEGGFDNDTVSFTVGGTAVNQTGIWKGGTNAKINLSVSKNSSLEKSNPTMTQTSIASVENTAVAPKTKVQITPTTNVIVKASPLLTAIIQSTSTLPEALAPPTSELPTTLIQSIPTSTTAADVGNVPATPSKNINASGIVISVLILSVVLWFIFVRKPK